MSFEFKGSARAYFPIWIVNVALTIITLGVYSAWASVRTRRYFFAHTLLDGEAFEYRGDPLRILKGRAGLAAVIASVLFLHRYPFVGWIVVAGVFLAPWFLVHALCGFAAEVSYRGQPFAFDRDVRAAYKAFGVGVLLSLVSFGILTVRWPLWLQRFVVPRLSYAGTRAVFEIRTWDYDRIFLKAIGIYFALVILLGICGAGVGMLFRGMGASSIVPGVALFTAYLGVGVVSTYLIAQIKNLFWSRIEWAGVKIQADYRTFDLLIVYLQNLMACLLTLGLAYPWAKVELARYKTSVLTRRFDAPGLGGG